MTLGSHPMKPRSVVSVVLLPIHPCRWCGAQPTAPLGEFCPASDPQDLDLHDFSKSSDGTAAVPLPAPAVPSVPAS